MLSWNMQLTSEYEEIASYQLYAYQEGSAPPSTTLWKKVGDVKALPLPMACTLTQVTAHAVVWKLLIIYRATLMLHQFLITNFWKSTCSKLENKRNRFFCWSILECEKAVLINFSVMCNRSAVFTHVIPLNKLNLEIYWIYHIVLDYVFDDFLFHIYVANCC